MIDPLTLVLITVLCVGWLAVVLWAVYIITQGDSLPVRNIRPLSRVPGDKEKK